MPGFRLNPATCDELVLREFFCEKYSLRISRNRIFIAKWCISSLEFRALRGLLQILKFRIGFSLNKGKSSSKKFWRYFRGIPWSFSDCFCFYLPLSIKLNFLCFSLDFQPFLCTDRDRNFGKICLQENFIYIGITLVTCNTRALVKCFIRWVLPRGESSLVFTAGGSPADYQSLKVN